MRSNPKYVVVNGLRHVRRLVRNIGGSDVMSKVLLPALAGTGGMLAAQWLSENVSAKWLPGHDPKLVQLGTSLLGGIGTLVLAERFDFSQETAEAVVVGMGVAGAVPYLPKSALDTTVPTGPVNATNGLGWMIDISHAGAPYKGMLGLGMEDSVIDDVRRSSGPVSTVEPTDPVRRMTRFNPTPRVRERLASPKDRGYAGGIYARHLFSGQYGS